MNIGIITVYDSVSNLGSYLQAYAMQYVLKLMGHHVYFIEKISVAKRIQQYISHLNPKRAFFLRLHNGWNYLIVSKKFKFLKLDDGKIKLDMILFGSDEIWNMDNPYFCDPLFFGTDVNLPKIAYAASIGAMEQKTWEANCHLAEGLKDFKSILIRDKRTQGVIGNYVTKEILQVCDPTFLVQKEVFMEPVTLPTKPYILVYSYGLDEHMISLIQQFAKENGLMIVSVHFWHLFCDKVISCKPCCFGSFMYGAEYVFTSTFHGAVFAMIFHTRCCILPVRDKVRAVTEEMGQANRLISETVDYNTFAQTIQQPFNEAEFESILNQYRTVSMNRLEEALKCLQN